MVKRDKESKVKITLSVTGKNYENFKKLADSIGLSVSALIDMLMYFSVKYADKFGEIFQLGLKESFLKEVEHFVDKAKGND